MLLVTCLLAACGEASPSPSNAQTFVATPVPATTAILPPSTTAITSPTITPAASPASTVPATPPPTTLATFTSAATVTFSPIPPSPSPTVQATKISPSATPSPAPSVTPAPAPKSQVTVKPVAKSVILSPMAWEAQTWNNCAPVSALMTLSYYGITLTQAQCGDALRPNKGDKHVQPQELENFINGQPGIKTFVRENGTLDTLRLLLSNGIPVITQQWLHLDDNIGHYRVVRGYDTAKNILIFNDSMADRAGIEVPSDFQDKLWKGYDRRYFPVFTPTTESLVLAILGPDANVEENYGRALNAAQDYATKNPKDIDAWRNLGFLQYQGNNCKEALNSWSKLTTMLAPGPDGPYNKFLWYQLWPVECNNRLGNFQTTLKLVQPAIDSTKVYAEARYEKAVALAALNRKEEAKVELKLALLDDVNYAPTRILLDKLGG